MQRFQVLSNVERATLEEIKYRLMLILICGNDASLVVPVGTKAVDIATFPACHLILENRKFLR